MSGGFRQHSTVGTERRLSAGTGTAWRVIGSGGDGPEHGISSRSSSSTSSGDSGGLQARRHNSGTQGGTAVRSKPSRSCPRRDVRAIAETTASAATITSSRADDPTPNSRGTPTRGLLVRISVRTSQLRAWFTLVAPTLRRCRRSPLLRARGRPIVPARTAASLSLASEAPLIIGNARGFESGRWWLCRGRQAGCWKRPPVCLL